MKNRASALGIPQMESPCGHDFPLRNLTGASVSPSLFAQAPGLSHFRSIVRDIYGFARHFRQYLIPEPITCTQYALKETTYNVVYMVPNVS